MKKLTAGLMSMALVALALGLMAFTPASAVQAAAQALPTRTPRSGQQADTNMSLNLQRELNELQRETLHLNQANALAPKAQELIDKAQAKGVDVTDLNNALAAFKTQVAAAQASHDQAASILNAKNGFDANNQVTDRTAAHQTLVDGRNALREAHLTLQNATLTLRTALQQWRSTHNAK